MRSTFTIDDDVVNRARAVAAPGIAVPELVRLALETFTRVEAGKRLAALGGAAHGQLLPVCGIAGRERLQISCLEGQGEHGESQEQGATHKFS